MYRRAVFVVHESMNHSLKFLLLSAFAFLLLSSANAQNLAVYSTPSNSGANITISTGSSFTLELSYTMPVGCTTAEFNLTLPTGPFGDVVSYQSVTGNLGSGWSAGAATSTSAQFSGSDPAGNTQSILLGYKAIAGSICDGSQLAFQGSLTFKDASGNVCAGDLPTNVVTVTVNAPNKRTCSASILVPDPACPEDIFAVEVSVPPVSYYNWQRLNAVECVLTLSGQPTVINAAYFNNANQAYPVAFTTTQVGGATEVSLQWSGLQSWYGKDIVVYYTYDCASPPSAFTYQSEIRATDPCTNAAYLSADATHTIAPGANCCQTIAATLPPDLVVTTSYGTVCRGSCDEQSSIVTFNNYSSGTPLYDPQICLTIPEGLNLTGLSTNYGNSWLNGPISVEAYDPNTMAYVPITSVNPLVIPFTYTDLEICVTYSSGTGPTFPVNGALSFSYSGAANADPNETIYVSLTDNSQSFSVSGQTTIPVPSCNPDLSLATFVKTSPSGATVNFGSGTVLAVPSDKRTYQYYLKNISGTPLSSVTLTDVLPTNITACPTPPRFYQRHGSAPFNLTNVNALPSAFNAGSAVVSLVGNQFSFGPFDLPDNCDTNWTLIIEVDVEVEPQTPIGVIPNTFTLSGGSFSEVSSQGKISVQKHYSLEGEVLVDCSLPGAVGNHNPTDSTQVSAGSPVAYTYLVRNTGNIPVENVRIFSSLPRVGDTESGNCSQPRGSTMDVRYNSISSVSTGVMGVYTNTSANACAVTACAPTAAIGATSTSADLAYANMQGILQPGDELRVQVVGTVDPSAATGGIAKQDFQFCAYRPDIGQDVPPGVSMVGTVVLGADTCSVRDPFKCPREFLIDRGNCCYELELIPELPKGPDSIVINVAGLGFNGATIIDPNFTIVSQTSSTITIVANSLWTNAALVTELCFNGSGAGAVTFEYFCTDQMVSCSQSLPVRCIDPVPPCLSAIKGDVQCDSATGEFFFEFCYVLAQGSSVQNFDLISSLPVFPTQTPPTFAAMGVTPTTINYDYSISGNMPFNVCGFRVNLPGAVPGQTFNFQLVGSDSTGTSSCLDSLWNGTLTIPPNCRLSCDEGYEVTLTPANNSPSGEACYDVFLENFGPTTIIDRLALVGSPGAVISTVSSAAPYTVQQSSTSASWYNASNPLLGFPVGLSSLGTICYQSPGPGQVTINYQDGLDVLCSDTLIVQDVVDINCVTKLDASLECIGGAGEYELNLFVDNPGNVTINAYEIHLASGGWSTVQTTGVSIPAGTSNNALVHTIPSGVLNPAGGQACFIFIPLQLDGEGNVIGECPSERICIDYRECGDELGCECGDWDYFQLGTNKGKKDISCGTAYEAPCQTPLILEGQYACQGEDCEPAGYSISITDPRGTLSTYYVNGAQLYFAFPALADGIYIVTLTIDCGGKKCVCEFQLLIDCDGCIGYELEDAISIDDLDFGFVDPDDGYISVGSVLDANGNSAIIRSYVKLDYSGVPRDANIVSATLNLAGNASTGAYADKSIRPRNSRVTNDLLVFPVETPITPLNELKWDNQPEALLSPDSLVQGGLFVDGPYPEAGLTGVNLFPILEQLSPDRRALALGMRLFDERSSGDRVAAFSKERRSFPLERAQCQICYTRTSSTVIAPVANHEFQLSPNPVSTQLTLTREALEGVHVVRVVDLYGHMVQKLIWSAGESLLHIDANELTSGTYVVLVDDHIGTRLMAKKVVVVR